MRHGSCVLTCSGLLVLGDRNMLDCSLRHCPIGGGSSFFEINLHGSEMILAGNFKGFRLLCADILLGAFNAGMTEQQLGRAQVAGLPVDMGWEGPTQRMQSIETGIDAGLVQPGPEQPPELALAEMDVRPPGPLPREQPAVQRPFRRGQIGAQAIARAHGQSRLDRTGMAIFGFLLPDLHDLAHPGRGGDVRDPEAHQVGAPETGIKGGIKQRQAAQISLLAQDEPDQGNLVRREGWFLAHHTALVPDGSRGDGHGQILAGFRGILPSNLA